MKLENKDYIIQLRSGLRANLEKLSNWYNYGPIPEGEPLWTTDTKHLFIVSEQSASMAQVSPVQTLDMAVTYNDEVVCNDGEVVFNF